MQNTLCNSTHYCSPLQQQQQQQQHCYQQLPFQPYLHQPKLPISFQSVITSTAIMMSVVRFRAIPAFLMKAFTYRSHWLVAST
jgi:hypothetical protein